MKKRSFCAIALSLAAIFMAAFPVLAYYNPGKPSSFVSDYANIIPDSKQAEIESKLVSFKASSSNEISVVTIKSLEGDTIENFANKLFADWGIGSEKNDNGVLLLVALDDRQMRIETGYGLEGALPDATAYSIINKTLKPAFKLGDYGEGIDSAVDNMMAATAGEYTTDSSPDVGGFVSRFDADVWGFLIFTFFSLLSFLRHYLAKSKSFWQGGVFGGIAGLIISLIFFRGVLSAVIFFLSLGGLGLLLDYLLSRVWPQPKNPKKGNNFWFFGGGSGGSSGGGFGGFTFVPK